MFTEHVKKSTIIDFQRFNVNVSYNSLDGVALALTYRQVGGTSYDSKIVNVGKT